MASRALREHSLTQAKAIEELSSGRRINRASDDAAGLGISVTMRARVRSELMAQKNVSFGLSAVNIAEAGLGEIQELVTRLTELATQSASDTITDTERAYVQKETTEILQEITALAQTTKFNGKKLLAKKQVDVGFLIDGSGSMDDEIDQVALHAPTFKSNLEAKGFDIQFGVAISGKSNAVDNIDATAQLSDMDDPNFSAALNATKSTGAGLQDPFSALLNSSGAADLPGTNDPDAFSWRPGSNRKLIHVTDTGRETQVPNVSSDPTVIGSKLAAVNVEAHIITKTGNGGFKFLYESVADISGGKLYDIGNGLGDKIPDALNAIEQDIIGEFGKAAQFDFQVGADVGDVYKAKLPLDATASGLGLGNLNLETKGGAQTALDQIKSALDTLAGHWATLGAIGSRFSRMESQLSTVTVHERQSISRIQDADIAQSSSQLSRAQILSQSSASILAQAQQINANLVMKMLERM